MVHRTARESADDRSSVAALYEDKQTANAYLEKRMQFSWQRLLHRRQVEILSSTIADRRPASVLELAPGPARVSVDVSGVSRGVMVENSEEMIRIARKRLQQRGLDAVWSVLGGSAFDLESVLGDQKFDLAYAFRFIRHFREAERAQLYRAIRERLGGDGVLVFDVVNRSVRDALNDRKPDAARDELNVFDATYASDTFRSEMQQHGFRVVGFHPVIAHFRVQAWLCHKGDDLLPGIVAMLVKILEVVPSNAPLEWVAICAKD